MKNKNLILIGAGVLLILLAIVIFVSDDTSEQTNITQNINTNLDVSDDGKKIYENKIDAYKQEINDSLINKNASNVNFDDFGNISDLNDFSEKKDTVISSADTIKIAQDLIDKPVKEKQESKPKTYRYHPNNKYTRNLKRIENEVKKEEQQNDVVSNKNTNQSADDWLKSQSDLNEKVIEKKQIKNDNDFDISIYGDQYIKNNSRVKLITNSKITINNKSIPKNTIIYGFARFGKNRIFITVKKIKNIRVNYQVIDANDMYPGIYVENENLLDEVKDEVVDDELNNIDNTGILKTAKNLIKKKKTEVKIFLMNNYKLKLITNENN